EKFLAAAEACGFPRNSDFNGPLQEGVGLYHVAQHDGSRCSNAHAFLHPIERRRGNLTVITGARATRILFEGKRAVGAAWRRRWRRTEHTVKARREVLL